MGGASQRPQARPPQFSTTSSERDLEPELNLTRGSGLAGRKPRPRDLREGRAAGDVPRRTEVGMIEEIEDVHPELQARARPGPDGPDDRDVRVVEGRSD